MIQQCILRKMMFFFFFLLFPLPALAIPTVSLSFAGNNSFLLSGMNLEDAGKIQLAVSYDASSLANPRLIPKNFFAGATVTVDGDTAGTAHLTVASSKPMNGMGPFATLAFDPVGTSVGTVRSLNGRVYGTNGASLPVIFEVTNPTPQLDPSDPDDIPMIEEREKKGQTFMGGDVAYMPPEATGANESREQTEKSAEATDAVVATGENAAEGTAESKVSPILEKVTEAPAPQAQSVLERFGLFKGEHNAKNLMALFDAAPAVSFRQDPPIFLADGKGSVRVAISGVAPGKVPSFTFRSARYVSFRKLSETEWLVEVKPDKGVLKAGIMLLDDGKLQEIPLTVAPKARVDLISRGKVSEADFAMFLKERGTKGAPRFDLNGDGIRDYLDDYIFTANYLVEQEKKVRKEPTAQQAPQGKGVPEGGRLKKS